MRGYQRYREESLNTMTQGELLLLLYDELVKRLRQADLEMGKQNYENFEKAVDRAVEIIRYLSDTLDQLKQGAFPRTAAAGDKDKLPLAYYQIDIFYHSNPSIFLLIIFADLFQAYFRPTGVAVPSSLTPPMVKVPFAASKVPSCPRLLDTST